MGVAEYSSHPPRLSELTFDSVTLDDSIFAEDRATSFNRWPLRVTFYAEDVFRVWKKWTTQQLEALPPYVAVTLDKSFCTTTSLAEAPAENAIGIQGISVGYDGLKSYSEKARNLLATSRDCVSCNGPLPKDGSTTLVCPNAACDTVGHLECFATIFLAQHPDSLIPTTGNCPGCGTQLMWVDLVKELSLRLRGEKEVEKMFKIRRTRGMKALDPTVAAQIVDEHSEDDEEMEDVLPTNDEWHYLSDSSDHAIDRHEVMSDPSPLRKAEIQPRTTYTARSEAWIEDSDWDDAEIIN